MNRNMTNMTNRTEALNRLRAIYSRRPNEPQLTFKQWLLTVQKRAEQMYGVKPANVLQLLNAVNHKVE